MLFCRKNITLQSCIVFAALEAKALGRSVVTTASADPPPSSASGGVPSASQAAIFKKVVYNMIEKKEFTSSDMFQYLRKNRGMNGVWID